MVTLTRMFMIRAARYYYLKLKKKDIEDESKSTSKTTFPC